MMRATLAAGLLFGLLGVSAAADPSGTWAFKTDIKVKNCSISGTMTIEPSKAGRHSCAFTSRETCAAAENNAGVVIDQVCTVIPQPDDTLVILSQVIQSITPGYNIENYLADHFSLKDIRGDWMAGDWWDEQFTAPVIFWRDKNLPVS